MEPPCLLRDEGAAWICEERARHVSKFCFLVIAFPGEDRHADPFGSLLQASVLGVPGCLNSQGER